MDKLTIEGLRQHLVEHGWRRVPYDAAAVAIGMESWEKPGRRSMLINTSALTENLHIIYDMVTVDPPELPQLTTNSLASQS